MFEQLVKLWHLWVSFLHWSDRVPFSSEWYLDTCEVPFSSGWYLDACEVPFSSGWYLDAYVHMGVYRCPDYRCPCTHFFTWSPCFAFDQVWWCILRLCCSIVYMQTPWTVSIAVMMTVVNIQTLLAVVNMETLLTVVNMETLTGVNMETLLNVVDVETWLV